MRIKFERTNFETECMYDCINGKGFLIKEGPFSDVDKSIRNMDGPRSPRFGTTYGDSSEFMERCRCECGRTVGAAFEGEICPHCGKEVKDKDIDMLYTGYINLYPYKIISPIWFKRLQSALSKKVLDNIISNENTITADGIIRKHNDTIEIKKSQLIYYNIGLKNFEENFEEIMTYYKRKRKQKADLIDELIEEKGSVWTSKIPVYSTALRQHSISQESYFFSPIDREINPMVNISINLKHSSLVEVPLYLFQLQMRALKLWDINFTLIDGKNGWARSNVLGGEWNYSGRSVIVLDPTLKMNEVDVSYKQFLEQYKGLIIRRIRREKGWTITKITNYIEAHFEYDEYLYQVMMRIVKEERPPLIINRNPGIAG